MRMQVFGREYIHRHCVGAEWPSTLGQVQLGESFVIETERFNLANGPIEIAGVRAGEAIAIHVEQIEMLPPFEAPNGGPFVEGMGASVPLIYEDGILVFPQGFRLTVRPSVGNLAVLPEPTEHMLEMARADHLGRGWRRVVNDPRGKHCHQDCGFLTEDAILHMRAQVDGAGVCVADVHAYIGQGETAFSGVEVAANVQLRVVGSTGWLVDWPVIETADEIMVFCSDTQLMEGCEGQGYVDVVREAYRAMREVVAARMGAGIEEANPIVAAALDIRNCAVYGLGDYVQKEGKTGAGDRDIAVVGTLPRESIDVF
jgi:acetamidase/formamidase